MILNLFAGLIKLIKLFQQKVKKKESKKQQDPNSFGLGVAQIVITAATPMEEIEHPFPGDEEAAEGDKKTEEAPKEDPPKEEAVAESEAKEEVDQEVKTEVPKPPELEDVEEKVDDLPTDSGPFPVSSSSGSDGAESISGPSTAENSQSLPTRAADPEPEVEAAEVPDIIPNKMIVGGRASIPDELQPDQLEKLQSLKESNA